MRLALKILFLLLLAAAIFGAGWYFTDKLFRAPVRAMKEEKLQPPPPPPPDESLPELARVLELQKQEKWIEARTALETFCEQWPDSTKIDDAREALGAVNAHILFSPTPSPEKQLYVVKSGDVLTRVAARLKSSEELIMRANKLSTTMLRISQRLSVPPTAFSAVLSRKENKLILSNGGRFFRQYAIRSWPVAAGKGAAGPAVKLTGRVVGKLSWADGQVVNFSDKSYAGATHWVNLSLTSFTLYSEPREGDAKAQKPVSGVALAPEAMAEIAAVLRKGDVVTVE